MNKRTGAFILIVMTTLTLSSLFARTYGDSSRKIEESYNVFGDSMYEGRYLFGLAESYGADGGESVYEKQSAIFNAYGQQLRLTTEMSDFRFNIDIGFGLPTYFSPLTLNHFYDGVQIGYVNNLFSLTTFYNRVDGNLVYDKTSAETLEEWNPIFGISFAPRIWENLRFGVNYVNTHYSTGETPITALGVLGPKVDLANLKQKEEGVFLYVKFENPYSDQSGTVSSITLTVNGEQVIAYTVTDDPEFAYRTEGSVNLAGSDGAIFRGAYSSLGAGAIIYQFNIGDVVNSFDEITSIEIDIATKRDWEVLLSSDDKNYYSVYSIYDYLGELSDGSASFQDPPTINVANNYIAALISDSANYAFQGDRILAQTISAFLSFEEVYGVSFDAEVALQAETYAYILPSSAVTQEVVYDLAYHVKTAWDMREELALPLRVTVAYFSIGSNYGTREFIADDDDMNGIDDTAQETVYPYVRAIPGADKNYNGVADWSEAFIDSTTRAPYLRDGKDNNNNFVLDDLENDDAIDLPYRQAVSGVKANISFFPAIANVYATVSYNNLWTLTNTTQKEHFAELEGGGVFNFAHNISLTVHDVAKYIFIDTIRDPLLGKMMNGADDNRDGRIDEIAEITNGVDYDDDLHKEGMFHNRLYAEGNFTFFNALRMNVVVTHDALLASNVLSSGYAVLAEASYTWHATRRLTLTPYLSVANVYRDRGFGDVDYDMQVDTKTASLFLRYTFTEDIRFDLAGAITTYDDAMNYISFNRKSVKAQFIYGYGSVRRGMPNYLFLATYEHFFHDFAYPYEGNSTQNANLSIQLKKRL